MTRNSQNSEKHDDKEQPKFSKELQEKKKKRNIKSFTINTLIGVYNLHYLIKIAERKLISKAALLFSLLDIYVNINLRR